MAGRVRWTAHERENNDAEHDRKARARELGGRPTELVDRVRTEDVGDIGVERKPRCQPQASPVLPQFAKVRQFTIPELRTAHH